jgi:chemotaxis regulatin CheY-phosphate phosphatase CheZ
VNFLYGFFEDTDPNVKNLGEMTAKLYESIKLRLDQLADKGIENIDDMTPEDKKEFDYIVNILTRISDVDVSTFWGI